MSFRCPALAAVRQVQSVRVWCSTLLRCWLCPTQRRGDTAGAPTVCRMGCAACAKGWVASHPQVTSSAREADRIHHNGCRMAGLRSHAVPARCIGCGSHMRIDELWLGSALRCGGEPEHKEGRGWEIKQIPCSAAPHWWLGQCPGALGWTKGFSPMLPHRVSPQKKRELGKIDVCWIHFFPMIVGRWTLSGLVCWGRCERQPWCCPHPQSPSSCNRWDCAGNSSCKGSCESLSWHMPSKALIIDVYCIAHMCCTWQPARELKAARVLYLSCYLKNQIICISFWHCFFSLGSACQGSQCVQRSVCYV